MSAMPTCPKCGSNERAEEARYRGSGDNPKGYTHWCPCSPHLAQSRQNEQFFTPDAETAETKENEYPGHGAETAALREQLKQVESLAASSNFRIIAEGVQNIALERCQKAEELCEKQRSALALAEEALRGLYGIGWVYHGNMDKANAALAAIEALKEPKEEGVKTTMKFAGIEATTKIGKLSVTFGNAPKGERIARIGAISRDGKNSSVMFISMEAANSLFSLLLKLLPEQEEKAKIAAYEKTVDAICPITHLGASNAAPESNPSPTAAMPEPPMVSLVPDSCTASCFDHISLRWKAGFIDVYYNGSVVACFESGEKTIIVECDKPHHWKGEKHAIAEQAHEIDRLGEIIDNQEPELAELRRDKERLDALQSHDWTCMQSMYSTKWLVLNNTEHEVACGGDLRAAIDAAMKGAK